MSEGCKRALEELGYLYLSDTPRFYNQYKNIKMPRIFSNSDIKENKKYYEIKPYKKYLFDTNKIYIHRRHLVSE